MARKEKLPVYGIGTFVRLRVFVSDAVRQAYKEMWESPHPEEYVYIRVTEFPSARRITGVDLLTGTLRSFKFCIVYDRWWEVDPFKARPKVDFGSDGRGYDEVVAVSTEDAYTLVQNRRGELEVLAIQAMQARDGYINCMGQYFR